MRLHRSARLQSQTRATPKPRTLKPCLKHSRLRVGEQRAPREALAHTSYFTTGLSPCPGEPNTRDAPAVLLLVDSTQYHVAVDGR